MPVLIRSFLLGKEKAAILFQKLEEEEILHLAEC